eukprot:TRINITY_DN52705_c0_g1_i1.p1 TRINITY_DN52705_c0_g1~~TRINITY_DN52705_c0_g1_i1.p1  ORF type:complete len:280 (-),score=60.20 TRINITY_DN52705_c0_g1_i1:223-1062(-)
MFARLTALLLLLALAAASPPADDATLEEALEVDSECAADNSGNCGLNALQVKAAATETQDMEEDDDDEVLSDAASSEEEDHKDHQHEHADGKQNVTATEQDPALVQIFDGRRRRGAYPGSYGGRQSQCCLCKNGRVTWSATGTCSRCNGYVKRTVTPKKACQKGNPYFIRSGRKCAARCRNKYFSGAGAGGYYNSRRRSAYYHGSGGGSSYQGGPGYVPASPHHYYHHHHAPVVCATATSGTCSFFGCDKSRGATNCVKGKCVCKPGYCSNGSACQLAR